MGGSPAGGNLVSGIFLYIAATSIVGGILSLLFATNAGTGVAAAVCGMCFVVLFAAAVALRPGTGMDSVRSTLGVVSVLFLVACFGLVVGVADRAPIDTQTQLVRAAVAAGLFTLGMGLVAALIPSAVAAGLAMLGLVGTSVLASAAAGVSGVGLAAAAVVGAVVALELPVRVPHLAPHSGAASWMTNLTSPLLAASATVMAASFHGTPVAAAGLVGAALAVIAWRRRAVVAAISAAVPLSLVEAYVIVQMVGSDRVGVGLVELLIGLIVLVVVAVVRTRAQGRARAVRPRRVLPEELLLVAAAVVALIALSDLGPGGSIFGPGNPLFSPGFGSTEPTPSPLPPFPEVPTPPA